MDSCMYCVPGEKLASLMAPVAKLRVSTLFLLRDQSFAGRCVLMFEDHCKEVDEVPESKKLPLMQDLSDAVSAIRAVFKPDKVNYAIFGDEVTHLHVHLVPKYKGGTLWGQAYCSQAVEAVRLTPVAWEARIEAVRSALNSQGGKLNA